jgi:6-phosphogluconate dehydrogenase
MRIGMIGLGRMGGNMTRRLARSGIEVVGYGRGPEARAAFAAEPNVTIVPSRAAQLAALVAPRIVWLMVPAGAPTAETVDALASELERGDLVVDGGNSHYRDSQRRAALLAGRGIGFVDAGVSGGVWGLEHGYGLMLGGAPEHLAAVLPIVRALAPAPDRGWVRCGPPGSGHYVKMIHNGIEYGLMQAYAEGFALLREKRDFGLDVAAIAEAWRHGTVIRSWLLDLTAEFLRADGALEGVAPTVADSGEGRWTAQEAVELGVPAPVITTALMMRFASRGRGDFAARVLAMMRQSFGGHAVARAPDSGPARPA